MKIKNKAFGALALIGLFAACASSSNHKTSFEKEDAPAAASSNKNTNSLNTIMMSSSSAIEDSKDTLRKFIRTADIRFRAKDVIKASYSIEDIVRRFGGIVTSTDMRNNVDNTTTVPVSADSLLETTNYTIVNSITIHVPNFQLDTTLKSFAPLVDFMDYRIIKADNVRFKILWRMLEEMRLTKHNERLGNAVNSKNNNKIDALTQAENDMLAKDEEKDNATIDNLKTEDSIKYSSIKLSIYQRSSIRRELLADEKNITAYEPGFGYKLKEAIKDGWGILLDIILGLVHIWALLLIIGLVIYFGFFKWMKKPKL